jgi:AAA+ superfamily predicted ATPase
MTESRVIALSPDGSRAAWREGERIELGGADGSERRSFVSAGDFAFVGADLWILDDDRILMVAPGQPEEIVATGLPAGARLVPVPGEVPAVFVRQGARARFVTPERDILNATDRLAPSDLLIPLGGARFLVAGGARLAFQEVGGGPARNLPAPASGTARAGAAVFNATAIALALDTADGPTVVVFRPDGRKPLRIATGAWDACAFADAAGKIFLASDEQIRGHDLRDGRLLVARQMAQAALAVAADRAGARVLVAARPLNGAPGPISLVDLAVDGAGSVRRLDTGNAEPAATSTAFAATAEAAAFSIARAATPETPHGGLARETPAPPITDAPPVLAWIDRFTSAAEPDPPVTPAPAEPVPAAARYSSNEELLADHGERLRLLLARYLATHQLWLQDETGRRSNRQVSAKEVEAFLSRAAGANRTIDSIHERLEELSAEMGRRVAATPDPEGILWLERIRRRFQLSNEALDCLMVLFYAETNEAFARAFTHAWSDFTRKQVSIGFLAELLGGSLEGRTRVMEALDPDAPLRRFGLVRASDSSAQGLVGTELRINRRAVWTLLRGPEWLLDHPELFVRCAATEVGLADLILDDNARRDLWRLHHAIEHTRGPVRYQITGPRGVGRRTVVRALAASSGRPTVLVSVVPEITHQVPPRQAAAAVTAEALLADAWVCVIADDAQTESDAPPGQSGAASWLVHFYQALAENVRCLFVVSDRILALPDLDAPWAPFVLPYPSADTQTALWRSVARTVGTSLPSALDEKTLSQTFSLTAGSINAVVRRAVRASEAIGQSPSQLEAAPFLRAVRHELASRIGNEATRMSHHAKFTDIVLAPEAAAKVRDIIMFARYRKQVLEQWKLGEKISYGTSLSAMFSGPPGTGKTMVAGVIAGELGLELYRIDLATILSRWVGETEKNLARLFDEAERSQAILLFDEADSLFSKRTSVNSVQDRYANVQTNFLLQRIETYEGIAILTTNFESSIDEAFMRRIRFRVRFDMPTEEERLQLWRSFLLPTIPVGEDIDWRRLSREYEMAGGSIKNAVLRACIAAAEVGKGLTTRLLEACAEFELAETGRVITERFRSATQAL